MFILTLINKNPDKMLWDSRRIAGIFKKESEAKDIIEHSNSYDLSEQGYYNYACIEQVSFGLNNISIDAQFYSWRLTYILENTKIGKYTRIKRPEWAEQTCNFYE